MTTLNIKNSRILIVDDNPVNVMLLERMLAQDGCTNVHSTTDSREVMGLQRECNFDLILLDIQMPNMDGFEVMEALAGDIEDDYLPILVLTAQNDSETCVRALRKGAKDFITKPFRNEEALQRIRNMLEVRSLYNSHRNQAEVLEQQVRLRTSELRDTQLEIIRRLGAAGEYRDNETGLHIVRMSKSCKLLARASGMDETVCELILHASPMHDVGKIGIPDRILLKPGPLTADEWEIMKRHSAIGAEILGQHESEILTVAREIALRHHEKWDGSGYPDGLVGTDIPFTARVVAVCDVFDALTSERPYKKAWSVSDAVGYLKDNVDAHFESRLVSLFIDILPQILAIRERYADQAA